MFQFPRVKLASTSGEEVGKNHLNERTVTRRNCADTCAYAPSDDSGTCPTKSSGIQTHDPTIR